LRLRPERHLGYFPQVFSHLAFINACVHLIREDERVAAGQVTLTDAPSSVGPLGPPPLTSLISM
jgi:hypothetical protein